MLINTLKNHFWAKKRDVLGIFKWLPLGQHLEDTRRVALYLWDNWFSWGQRELVALSLEEPDFDEARNLICFIAATHDIAKATPVFQKKVGYQGSSDLDGVLIEKLLQDGFDELNDKVFAKPNKSPHALAGQYILQYYGVNEGVASIIGGHHGKPIDNQREVTNQKGYLSNYYQADSPQSEIGLKWDEAHRQILNRALELSSFVELTDVPELSQPGQVIMSGLLIMADWIASNELFFPLLFLNENNVADQDGRFIKGIDQWKATTPILPEVLTSIDELYHKRFGVEFKPRPFQRSFTQVIDGTFDGGLFILEAPMGLGKTEAALVGAEQLAQQKGKSGLFFGLPTQATSNGIFPRIRNWLQQVEADYHEEVSLQLVHGKASLNEAYSQLKSRTNIEDEEEIKSGVTVNQWFTGRKTSILDDFVVGTVDQFLLAALKQKHLALRHLGLSKKVVVIDEAHAYDTYMSQYLYEAITWMGAYDVPVIILSATLPAEKRLNLVKAYLKGKDPDSKKRDYQLNGFTVDSYPLVTYTDGYEIKQFSDFEPIDSKLVEIHDLAEEDLEKLLEEFLQGQGVFGIFCNTVRKAQKFAKYFSDKFGEDKIELLHSGFIATDRAKKENQLMKMIGKNAQRPAQRIIIGTQVIEQSLDIDFDVMITELAPMDLLIQRLGRLHRHKITRSKAFEVAKCYVIGKNDDFEFDSGSLAVYGGYLLARTQYYLPDKIYLPEDISPLVQKVYGESDLEIPDNLMEKYIELKNKDSQLQLAKEVKAKVYKLDDPVYRKTRSKNDNLVGWLKNSNTQPSEEKAYAQVRDSKETIEVIAVKATEGGYTFFGEQENISTLVADNKIAMQLANHTLCLPSVLTSFPTVTEATIDYLESYNYKTLRDWQDQAWLKGSLGIIFDQEGNFRIGEWLLHYDEKFGLSYERMDADE